MRNVRPWQVVSALVTGGLLGYGVSRGCGRYRCIEDMDESQGVFFAAVGAILGLVIAITLVRIEAATASLRARIPEKGLPVRALLEADATTRDLVLQRARDVTPDRMILTITRQGLVFSTADDGRRELTTLAWSELDLVAARESRLDLLVGDEAWSFATLDPNVQTRQLGAAATERLARRLRKARP